MHLGGAILIVAALVVAETASAVEQPSWTSCIVSIVLGMLVVVFSAAAISGLTATHIRENPELVRESLRGFARLRRLHTWLWFVVSAVGVLLIQWPRWIYCELRPPMIVVDKLVILLPLIAPLFLSYAAFFEVDRVAAAALGGNASGVGRSRWSFAWWFVRHEFGLVVAPVLAVVALRDVAELWVGPVSDAPAWAAGAALLAVLAGFPLLMRTVWPCTPLSDAMLQQAIAHECQAQGQPVPRVFQWNTGGRVVNAVVSGTLPRTHCVFLSDALLTHFSRAEILAVVRHELAHMRSHHVLLRVAALAVPLVVLHAVGASDVVLALCDAPTGPAATPTCLAALTAAALGLAAYALFVFGGFSRLLEMEADLLSCRPSRDNRLWDAERAQAAYAALYKLGCVYGFDRRSWLHPPISLRLRVLRASAARRQFAERLSARIRRWKLAILTSGLAAACLVIL